MTRVSSSLLAGLALSLVGNAAAAPPLWWGERGVLNSGAASDFSPMNQGQLKWAAWQAFQEIDAHAQRGNSAAASDLINGWLSYSTGAKDFAVGNIGQGKNVASILYSGLATSGLSVSLPLTTATAEDYAPLAIGQAKSLFNFNVFGIPTHPTVDPVIAEVISTGSTYPTSSPSDWIEIYNPTSATIDLHDYWLTTDSGSFDDSTRAYTQSAWQFPSGTTIAAGAYLVVLASGASGTAPLSANFKLDADGEYLALLYGPQKVIRQQFFPHLPKMSAGYSFGLTADLKQATFFAAPTPGAANGTSLGTTTLLAPPTIVSARGFKTASFALNLQKPTSTSKVYYLTGGEIPTHDTGILYNPASPPTISHTTVVCAFATDGSGSARKESDYVTASFIFPADVLTQSRPTGYPVDLPDSDPDRISIDYGMDSEVISHSSSAISTALLAIPSISISLPLTSLFAMNGMTGKSLFENDLPSTKVPYVNASFEWLDPRSGKPSMQCDMDVSISGDSSVYWNYIKKKSLKIRFNKDAIDNGVRFDFFDTGKAELVSELAVKNPTQDSWDTDYTPVPVNALYVGDQMVARTYQAMSQPGSVNYQPNNRLVHVYINGLYWGVYFMNERPDEAYMAKRLGGTTQQYESSDDTPLPGSQDDETTVALDSYIDYILAGAFLGTHDWPGNGNFRMAGTAAAPHQWQFFEWGMDSQTMDFADSDTSIVNSSDNELALYGNLTYPSGNLEDPDFIAKLKVHLQRACSPGGALSAASLHSRLNDIYSDFSQVAIAESARWGGGYDGTHSPAYGLSDLATNKAAADYFIDHYPHELFDAYNTRFGFGLTNPY